MRLGFNWWYVTTLMSLVIAGVAGFLNSHKVGGARRDQCLYGAMVRTVGAGILAAIFGTLVFAESYAGIVQLILDLLSESDSEAWADLIAIGMIVILALVYGEGLVDLAKFCEKLYPQPRHGRIYRCPAHRRVTENGEVRWVLSARIIRRILILDRAREAGMSPLDLIEAGYEARSRAAQCELRQMEDEVRRLRREAAEMTTPMMTTPTIELVRPHVHGNTVRCAAPRPVVVELTTAIAQTQVVPIAPTAREIACLKGKKLGPRSEQKFEEIIHDPANHLSAEQQAVLERFFEKRPELKPIVVSGRYCVTLRINSSGEVSVLKYSRA